MAATLVAAPAVGLDQERDGMGCANFVGGSVTSDGEDHAPLPTGVGEAEGDAEVGQDGGEGQGAARRVSHRVGQCPPPEAPCLAAGGVEVLLCLDRRATSRSWARVRVATGASWGREEPLASPAAVRSSAEVGGVLVARVKERSSLMVMTAGTISPRWCSVAVL